MKCACCGAEVTGRFCEYCGTEAKRDDMPGVNNGNAQANNATTQTIINNYYTAPNGGIFANQSAVNPAPQTPAQVNNQSVYRSATVASGSTEVTSSRNKVVMIILWFFLGVIGAHHFYAGRIGMGLLYLFTGGLCGIGLLVDLILILTGNYRDCEGKLVK